MKKLLTIPILTLLIFCSSKNNIEAQTNDSKGLTNKKEINCPTDGRCAVDLFKNKKLVIKHDDLGSIYYQVADNNNTSVILFKYERNVEVGVQDANYSEEIVFEINNSDTSLRLSNESIQSTKMLFGRHCFCRGQAGYYEVNQGHLNLEKKNQKITMNLDFKVSKVPQVITDIQTTIE
jgi:hypothetical protein